MGQIQTKAVEEKLITAIRKRDIKTLTFLCMINPTPPLDTDLLHSEANKIESAQSEHPETASPWESLHQSVGTFTRTLSTLVTPTKKPRGDEFEEESKTPASPEASSTDEWGEQSLDEKYDSARGTGATGAGYKPEDLKAVEHSVDVSEFEVSGLPLICYTAKNDRPLLVRFFCKVCLPRADVNQHDGKWWRPLHHAASAGAMRTVDELLSLGAFPQLRNNLGLLPYQCASNSLVYNRLQALVNTPTCKLDYKVTIAPTAMADQKIAVQYECPEGHSDKDFLAWYYVVDDPWNCTRRLGAGWNITPFTVTGTLHLFTVDAAAYRVMYIDGKTGTVKAASDICYVHPKFITRAPLPSNFDPDLILHPQYKTLSEKEEDFLTEVPAYFNFNFTLNALAVQTALQLDPILVRIRKHLVPTKLTEFELWRNYFYRMVLLEKNAILQNEKLEDLAGLVVASPAEIQTHADVYGVIAASEADDPREARSSTTETHSHSNSSTSKESTQPKREAPGLFDNDDPDLL